MREERGGAQEQRASRMSVPAACAVRRSHMFIPPPPIEFSIIKKINELKAMIVEVNDLAVSHCYDWTYFLTTFIPELRETQS